MRRSSICRDAAVTDLTVRLPYAPRRRDNPENLHRAALNTTVDAIAVIDRYQIVHSFNRAAERMFGYAAGEVVGRHIGLVLPDPICATEDFYLDPGRLAPSGIWREVRGCRRDGSIVAIDLSAAEWVDGVRPLLTATMRDAEPRKAIEARLREVGRMVTLGQVAGGHVHDFNNIMLVIGNMVEIAQSTLGPDNEAWEPLDLIRRAAGRANLLARRVLSFARPAEARRERVDLARVVGETLDLLRRTIPRTVAVRWSLGEAIAVIGDPAELEQVVMNLAINAADAIGDEPGAIDIVLDRDGHFARLAVSDDGPGMPAEVVARAAEPFFTTKPAGVAAGLGLAVVHGIAAGHGATLAIDSAPGIGTSVTIRLPLAGPD